jgi:hypothetical protein
LRFRALLPIIVGSTVSRNERDHTERTPEMSQARYITLATLSLIAAIFVADGTLLESAPDWIKGVLIGLGAALALRLTVRAAHAGDRKRDRNAQPTSRSVR